MIACYDSAEIAAFQDAVASMITQIESKSTGHQAWDQDTFGAAAGSDRAIEEVLNQTYRDSTRGDAPNDTKEEFRLAAIEARSALKSNANRAAFCKVLVSATQGSQDVANILVPAFLPMAVAGTIAVPVAPLVWALVAITIARIGVSRLCRDQHG